MRRFYSAGSGSSGIPGVKRIGPRNARQYRIAIFLCNILTSRSINLRNAIYETPFPKCQMTDLAAKVVGRR
jgi:hypothetical protein